LKNIANSVLLNTEPKLYPDIKKVELEGKTCIHIHIGESPIKPHLAFGKPFARVGPTTQKLSSAQYEMMLMRRMNGYGFDYQPVEEASLDDIDESAVYKFIETANQARNLNENLTLPVELLLEKLELMKNGRLTRAAILLFGKNPRKFFMGNYEILCGAFSEDKGHDFFLDNHEFDDNLFSNYNAALSFVHRNIVSTYKKGPPNGVRTWEVPLPVLQEAIVNMIVHKNYRIGVKNYIEIRPSWISFSNPGFLFKPSITIEKLSQPHLSRPGNILIAKAFFWSGLFENWGTGTLRIIEELKKAGKKAPEFSFEDDEIFRLKLYRN